MEDEIIGQIHFRLGWSIIRTKTDIEMGVENIKKANIMIPDNQEIMMKLAGALFQETGNDDDINYADKVLTRLLELDPNNSEAYILQAKIQHQRR